MKKFALCAATLIMACTIPLEAKAAELDPPASAEIVVESQNLENIQDTGLVSTISEEEFIMPTVDSMPDQKYAYLVAGTDQYNDLIKQIGFEYGIDPVFIKTIMAVESCGEMSAKNGSHIGLYQIAKSFGYDTDKMFTDSDYATRAACEVINGKAAACDSKKVGHSIYYVAKFYNGSSSYGKKVGYIYNQLCGKSKDTSIYLAEQ